MAKKSKKAAKKAAVKAPARAAGRARPAAKKGAKKPASGGKRAGAATSGGGSAGAASGGMSQGVHNISTGRGPGPREIGADLVALFNSGKGDEVEKKWWSPAIVSVEGMGMAFSGLKAAQQKNSEWMENHEVLGGAAEGPYVGASGFAVKFRIHVRERATGKDIQMDEVGVYTVQDGKIVREEFMYGG